MSLTATLADSTTQSQPLNSTAPAGWYHDPLGLPQLRWWNGRMWTNAVQEPRPEVQVSSAYTTSPLGAH